MKDYKFSFEIDGDVFYLIFNLNVMEEIQEEYGTIEKWAKLTDGKSGEVNAKALIFGLTAMINEGTDILNEENGTNKPMMSTKQVGRMISKMGVQESATALNNAVVEATQVESKNV